MTRSHPCAAQAWIYAFDWPKDGVGFTAAPTSRSFVRCRRWVRPREPLDANDPEPRKPPPRTVPEDAGLIPFDDPDQTRPTTKANINLFT